MHNSIWNNLGEERIVTFGQDVRAEGTEMLTRMCDFAGTTTVCSWLEMSVQRGFCVMENSKWSMHDLLTFLFHVILVSFLLQLIKYPDKSNSMGKHLFSSQSEARKHYCRGWGSQWQACNSWRIINAHTLVLSSLPPFTQSWIPMPRQWSYP